MQISPAKNQLSHHTSVIDDIESLLSDDTPLNLELARETVQILHGLQADHATVVAGYLTVIDEVTVGKKIKLDEMVDKEVIDLYVSSQQLWKLPEFQSKKDLNDTAGNKPIEENLRKMLIAMIDDVRVVLICLAYQLAKLHLCKDDSEFNRRQMAYLTREIYVPLANRLGIWQLKWELEDYSFRYLEPNIYKELVTILKEKRIKREQYIEAMVNSLRSELRQVVPEAEVYGRPKNIYSIWKKMQRKGLEFSQLWDVRAVRILVNTVNQCYEALSLVHRRWSYYSDEFEDYITTPKNNGYQSIHTIVNGPDNQSVEIQIRTFDMHADSELGLAAHWRYKEGIRQDANIDSKVIWLRELLEWKEQIIRKQRSGHAVNLHMEPESQPRGKNQDDTIYVFTPNGKVIDLPNGATPIDFAYAIHTQIGHRARRAIVDGKMVTLYKPLETGNRVQIQTVKEGGPSLDWLRGNPIYVRTRRARNRISNWHKRAEYDKNVSQGRSILEKEMSRLGLADISYAKINQHTNFQKVDDLLAAIGTGEYRVKKTLHPFITNNVENVPDKIPLKRPPVKSGKDTRSKFIVEGVENLITHQANCCIPMPGEEIIGYITSSSGITIHRKDCINVTGIDEVLKDRLIKVEWDHHGRASYTVNIQICANHQRGLLNDIFETLKSRHVELLNVNTETDSQQISRIQLKIGLDIDARLEPVLQALMSVRNVLDAKRIPPPTK